MPLMLRISDVRPLGGRVARSLGPGKVLVAVAFECVAEQRQGALDAAGRRRLGRPTAELDEIGVDERCDRSSGTGHALSVGNSLAHGGAYPEHAADAPAARAANVSRR